MRVRLPEPASQPLPWLLILYAAIPVYYILPGIIDRHIAPPLKVTEGGLLVT